MGERDSFMVIGASGLIGSSIWRKLPLSRRVGTFHNFPSEGLVYLDIRDKYQTRRFLCQTQPTTIYHVAALPNVDWCETHQDECWATNVIGTQNIVLATKEVGAKLVFFSSDYIFDGKHGPYTEDDHPSPINVYGKAKLAAEQIIQESLTDYLIIRVTVVYGWETQQKNFMMRLLQKLRRRESLQVPMDQIGNPTYVENLTDVVLELIQIDQRGIFHVVGPERLTRYDFACLAAHIFELDATKIIPVTTDALDQDARRPLNAGMRIEKVQKVVSTSLLCPQEGLLRMKQQERRAI